MKTSRISAAARSQRGAYAIEFALVFLIFFSLLYAIICYGMLFTFRVGLQNAAEDGARAALQYQNSLEARRQHAQDVAKTQSNWMPPIVNLNPVAQICTVEDNICISAKCGSNWTMRCQIVVTVTATNLRALLPPLPNFAIPDQIVGQASMLLDGKSQ
ncbi:Flp pilus assembly protein TadG [Variovorax boronicumulans]|uniref:TadE/TadG family type IV pilus assembly protein n=1 Tax=Variovorax boronicumulans TaxID=436515 RepID=UPI00277F871E|nr:TadE/TadG family type IV pilus assembly protein [Variovorax boronicumulans]MDP9990585.1 Flp pilus assembly protein TadG [Variovorax boronicumulans]MDQ0000904.1 Flp pilus assembly protein TadG [Variovorax boronicumulans]